MSRSKWKGPFINTKVLPDLENKSKILNIMTRNSEIVPSFVGLNFNIHNGKTFVKLMVTNDMVSHKFGEFSLTRKKFTFNKSKKK